MSTEKTTQTPAATPGAGPEGPTAREPRGRANFVRDSSVTPDGPQDTAQDSTDADDADEGRTGAEAAKYRRRLRETEAERDALAARVEALQRAEVERVAADTLARPEALWAAGTDLAALLTEDGAVDPEAVAQAVTDARDRLGLAPAQRTPRADPSQGGHGEPPQRPRAHGLRA